MNKSIFDAAFASLPERIKSSNPIAALVLGSGWNKAVDSLEVVCSVSYADISGLGAASVQGHDGRLLLARDKSGKEVLVFCGRRHWYEGAEWETVVMPAVLTSMIGAKVFLVTNAAGGVNSAYTPGDMVIIGDHLRLSPLSPLRGTHDPFFGPRFPDQSCVYDKSLRDILKKAGSMQGLSLSEGVYAFTSGPAFETPIEVKAYKVLGADLVGMSTVPETMVAHSMGLKVAGVSFVSNYAAGISSTPLDGNDVVECAQRNSHRLSALLLSFISLL